MRKKIISVFVVITIICGICTYAAMLPELDVIRNINIMEIVKFLNLPERTVFYINRIFSNDKGNLPVSGEKNTSGQEKALRFLIFSVMSAILLPATSFLVRPGSGKRQPGIRL